MASTSTVDTKKPKSTEMKKKLNVLIVDDDSIILKFHQAIINKTIKGISKTSKKGEETVIEVISKTAKNGEEAVNIHRDGASFDLILMDMEMPVMDGVLATKKIREMEEMEVKSMIVGVTSVANDEDKRRAFMDAGLKDCLEKPLTEAKILPFIKELMEA